MARMQLGQIVATRGVVGLMRENNDFAAFVHRAFQRYLRPIGANCARATESRTTGRWRMAATAFSRPIPIRPTRSGKSGSLPSGTAAPPHCCFPTSIRRRVL